MPMHLAWASAAFGLLVASMSVQANSIEWTLQGVAFDDGGTATGSFFYDRDTNTYSNASITTTAGTALPGQAYEYVNPDLASYPLGLFVSAIAEPVTGTPTLNMNFLSQLTNSGGIVTLDPFPAPAAFESSCFADLCDTFTTPDRFVISGTVVAVVPVPAAAWLFGSALGLLAWLRQRLR